MDSLDAATHTFRPRSGTMDAWNAAYVRVEDYLRAHRIHNRLHQSRLIEHILERAAQRHAATPGLDPTTLAAEETEKLMDEWFRSVLQDSDIPPDRIASTGRVALLLCDGPQKWPYAFLNSKDLPAEFVSAMKNSSVEAGPDMKVSSMVPREIDLGVISEAAGETLEQFEKWPWLGTIFLWLLFLAALFGTFYLTH